MKMPIDTKKKTVIKALETLGFSIILEREHIKMRNEAGVSVSVPNHKRIKGSTLHNVCVAGGIDKKKFYSML